MPKRREDPPARVEAPPAAPPISIVPDHERCPLCWGNWKGRGKKYGEHPPKGRVYLKCQQCGHSWTVDLKTEVVAIDHRLPPELTER